MTPMSLSHSDLVALADDMRLGPYLMSPRLQMLDLNHRVLDDLSDLVTDGQVDCKLEGKPRPGYTPVSTRSLSVTLVDPRRQVAIDGADPARGALFYDKMLSVGIAFKGPRIGRWVTIPVFCGPITNAVRSGWTAQVTCQGKERLAVGMVWTPRTYRKGADKITVIRDLLVRAGETGNRVRLPGLDGRLPGDLSLKREDQAWSHVTDLVGSMNRQGMYDARGDFRMRAWPRDPAVVFRDGQGGSMLTQPEVTYSAMTGYNGVLVKGATLASGKVPQAVVWLPAAHPRSPHALARNGVPYRRAQIVTNPKVRTDADARAVAATQVRRLARETTTITVDVLPNWLLEPGDVVGFTGRSIGHLEQTLTELSLPLMPGAAMSLGAVKKIKRPQRRIRRRHP